jgi:metal-responsive CopG/Arc/MetJ family transcriptional regulator
MKSTSGTGTAYRKITITLDNAVLAAVDAAAAADHRTRSAMIAVILRRILTGEKCKQQD